MRIKIIVMAVRAACNMIGMQYRDRKAVEAFQRKSTEAKGE